MFAITSKAKIAAGIAAGALTLGAVGAYAANANNNGTIPVKNLQPVTLSGNAGTLKLASTNGKTTTLTLPATFSNQGQCVSFFAQHQDLVLAPAAGVARISKNSHGKLISSTIKTWCQARLTAKTKTDNADTSASDTEQPEATDTDTTDTTDSTAAPSGASQGHSLGHSHGHDAD